MIAVELKHVSFSYKDKENVLENIDFCANYGEIDLIAGYSGKGKSTILSIISGIIPNVVNGSLEGDVLIDGNNIKGKKLGEICRSVGMVLQNADEQIVNNLVEDEIAFGLENFAYPSDKIAKQIDIVCKLMNLDKKDKTKTLSGGGKQRLITASTIAMGQKIILFDEPLANLDKESAVMLMEICKTLKKEGYCIIIVEHRLDMVLPYVDNVWNVENKKITKVDNKQEYLVSQSKTILDNCEDKVFNEPLFIFDNVDYSIKDKKILTNINCTIKKGARTVILGENGCGKTTLISLIARLNKPTNGKITQYVDESLNKRANKKWFKKVGVVYQNPDYQLFMPTVRKELEFGAKSKEYANEVAKMFEIENLLDCHPQSLSEGQKRRVSIAAVVATSPDVLLLDEPTVGQDYNGLQKMIKILNELNRKNNISIITITHDVRCAKALTDYSLVFNKGKLVKEGKKELVDEYFCC